MKKLIISSILLLSLASFSVAIAENEKTSDEVSSSDAVTEDKKVSGEVCATGTWTSVGGNKAGFNEYRDIRNGVYGDIKLKYDSGKYYTEFNARDMGYDTQKYGVEGGKWGDFKLYLNYDEIPHNYTDSARSFYSGIGTPDLDYPNSATQQPNQDASTWNTFGYSTKRKNSGAGFKLDVIRPFFFDVTAASEEKTGVYPMGAAGTSPGGISIELPAPISYRTDSIKLAAGYSRNPLFLSFGYFYSNFSNDDLNLHFLNPGAGGEADTTTMPPENRYYKINLTGGIRLPANSKLDINLSTASARSDGSLLKEYIANSGDPTRLQLSDSTFDGEIDTRNIAVSLTSRPYHFLDTRFFYKYLDKENKSDQIMITDGTSIYYNDLFDYKKVKFGAELGFRLPAKFYLNTNYSHETIDRKRDDIPENTDDLYGVELRWTGLDFMTARVGYERLNRKAEFYTPEGGTSDVEYFIRRFDAAEKHMDSYKVSLDFFPTENLNFSLGYRHRETDYPDTILGLTGDRRDEFSIEADYLIGRRVKLFGFFDYERIKQDQFQRQAGLTDPIDPNTSPTESAFNWTASQEDESYSFSIGTDIFIIPDKLTLRLQHSYLKSDGSVDYTYLLGGNPLPDGRTQDNIDLEDWDAYRLRYCLVRLTYNATKAWSITAGYAYEKYDYSDDQYNGYSYVPATTGTNGAYLTGAYRDPSCESHTGFLTLSYRF